jgi:chemotaxis protein CheX
MDSSFNIGEEIVKGTKDVFSTMVMVELESETVCKSCNIDSNLTSMIGLGGGIRGMLAIHCSAAVATAITGSFLGMDVEEINEDVKDAVGEVANMIAGNLKVSYASIDMKIELAIPTSIIGDSFVVTGIADTSRVIAPFSMPAGKFWVELMYVNNA